MAEESKTYAYTSEWLGKPQPLKVIVVGAGISGIAAVKIFKEDLADMPVKLTLYDKNHDVGGTWLENRYPGCACDIPAHGYTYSWEGNPHWSGAYVEAKEIFDYYKKCARSYGVFDHVRLRHKILGATWNEDLGKWSVEVENLDNETRFLDEAEVLINAGGFLNWKWPEIPGLKQFRGVLLHSAKWDHTVNFSSKSIAVIGSGSSAIQIVPQLQKEAKSLISFNRSPTWITPEFGAEFAPQGRQTKYSQSQKDEWLKDPQKFLDFRKKVEGSAARFFDLQFKNSDMQQELFERFTKDMASILDSKNLSDFVIPKFAVGCRRMTPGHGYLEALIADNVIVTSDPISKITDRGLVTQDGTEYHLDIIVCATGFDTSYRPSFPVLGINGKNLQDYWSEEPRSYLSIAASGFPNYFMATGPNFPLANGSLIPCLEETLRYAFKAVRKIQSQGIKGIYPSSAAVEDFQEHKDAVMRDLVWTSRCRSWYKNGKVDGKVWGPWPGSALHFIELLREPRWEDFHITYHSRNRFAFLGNGKSKVEACGGDLAWYVTEPSAV